MIIMLNNQPLGSEDDDIMPAQLKLFVEPFNALRQVDCHRFRPEFGARVSIYNDTAWKVFFDLLAAGLIMERQMQAVSSVA